MKTTSNEGNLKILKVEYLSYHWSDLSQILYFISYLDQPNGRQPQKRWNISASTDLIRSYSNYNLRLYVFIKPGLICQIDRKSERKSWVCLKSSQLVSKLNWKCTANKDNWCWSGGRKKVCMWLCSKTILFSKVQCSI